MLGYMYKKEQRLSNIFVKFISYYFISYNNERKHRVYYRLKRVLLYTILYTVCAYVST